MRLLPRRVVTGAVVLVAAVAVAGCDALDGDLTADAGAPGAAATTADGDVLVTTDELLESMTQVIEVEPRDAVDQFPADAVADAQRRVLQVLLEDAVYGAAAEEQFGIDPPTAADVDRQIADLEEELGGAEQLDTFLESQNSSRAQERFTLPGRLLSADITAALEEQGEDQDLASWSQEVMADAQPLVARRFGAWDQAVGAVVPADSVSEPRPEL